jgi:uncharacterized protein
MKKITHFLKTDSMDHYLTLIHHHQRVHPYKSEQHLYYIDIETLGFNRNSDIIYLLGILEVTDENQLQLDQFLCQKLSDEYELLYTLNARLNEDDILIHFNGDSFDLPFIKSRMALYGITEKLSSCVSIDYLKLLRPFKKIFKTDNFKLKTLEKIALYTRADTYTGGDLIPLYNAYIQGNKLLERSFLEHNQDDLLGLFHLNIFNPLLQLSASIKNKEGLYPDAPSVPWSFQHSPRADSFLDIRCTLFQSSADALTYDFEVTKDSYALSLSQGVLTLTLPITEGVYTFFYEDYQNYYYLPYEDYAVHKIVADFVSTKHKKKATKTTAYIKKEGRFIGIPHQKSNLLPLLEAKNLSIPIFQDAPNAQYSYILYDDFSLCYEPLFIPIIHQLFIN